MMVQELALPVTYQSPLSARAQAKSVLLEWTVAEEINASHYAVEYLNDQNRWTETGRVNATGNNRYGFEHDAPREGENNYRLRQVDLDGTFAYSDVASVVFTDRFADIRVYPNPVPANTGITLTGLPPGAVLQIYDVNGRVVYRDLTRGTQLKVPTAGFPAGVLTIELAQGREGVVWQQRVVVE